MQNDTFTIAGKEYTSRLLVGTGKYKDLAETKAELIRWVVGVGVLQTTLVVAIIARLAKII